MCGVFAAVGAGSAVTTAAVLSVPSTVPVFPFVTAIDQPGDTSWALPVSDVPPQAGVIPELVQQSPVPGGPTPWRTEIRVLADRGGRNGCFFRFDAAGAKADGLISGPKSASTDRDGLWTVATRKTTTGWTAETHLPSRSVGFRRGAPSWGLSFDRYVPRGLVGFRWAGTTLDAKLWDLSRAGRLTSLANREQGLGLSATPYALGRRSDAAGSDAVPEGIAGIDVGWRPSPDLGTVVTVDTDLAETDVDTRQVNLTRFPLFFPREARVLPRGLEPLHARARPRLDVRPFPLAARRALRGGGGPDRRRREGRRPLRPRLVRGARRPDARDGRSGADEPLGGAPHVGRRPAPPRRRARDGRRPDRDEVEHPRRNRRR